MSDVPDGGAGETITVGQWVVALVLQTVAMVIVGAWRIARALRDERREVDQNIANIEHEINTRITSVEANNRQSLESAQRLYEATVEAVKQELHEHIVYVERHFARRESFAKVVDELKDQISDGFERIDRRLDRDK